MIRNKTKQQSFVYDKIIKMLEMVVVDNDDDDVDDLNQDDDDDESG